MKIKLTEKQVKELKPHERPYEVRDTALQGFLVRVQPSGSRSFYVDYRLSGKRRTRFRIGSHKKITVTSARKIAKKKLADIAHGKDIQAEKKIREQEAKNLKSSTLRGFLEHRYGPWVEQERRTGKATLARIRSNFEALIDRPLSDISVWLLEKWKAEQRKSGKLPSTIRRDIVALRAALSKAVDWGVIDTHPLKSLKMDKLDSIGRVRYLSDTETQSLRAALDDREKQIREKRKRGNVWRSSRSYEQLPAIGEDHFADHIKPMVILSLNTGLRRGELFDLRWEHVDFESCQLRIDGKNTKTGHTRYVPLNQEGLRTLETWRRSSDSESYVFPSKLGGRMDNVNKAWYSLVERAGLESFRWHDMRHDFASKLVMAGVDLNTVRELLGHADIKMTLRYAHLAPEHKAEAVSKLGKSRVGK